MSSAAYTLWSMGSSFVSSWTTGSSTPALPSASSEDHVTSHLRIQPRLTAHAIPPPHHVYPSASSNPAATKIGHSKSEIDLDRSLTSSSVSPPSSDIESSALKRSFSTPSALSDPRSISESKDARAQAQADKPVYFRNPWPSCRKPSKWDYLYGVQLAPQASTDAEEKEDDQEGVVMGGRGVGEDDGAPERGMRNEGETRREKERLEEVIEVVEPDWGGVWGSGENQAGGAAAATKDQEKVGQSSKRREARGTWLGHAGALLQLPPLQEGEASRPTNILFDPIFSYRCSPTQLAGPQRFHAAPCQVEDLPEVDIVCISHNHYDHLDLDTIERIYKARGSEVHFFAPLGNKSWFESLNIPSKQITEMDWWDEADLFPSSIPAHSVAADVRPASSTGQADASETEGLPPHSSPLQPLITRDVGEPYIRVVCVPAQHHSGRAGYDSHVTLWSGWVVEQVFPRSSTTASTSGEGEENRKKTEGRETRFRAYHAGDTGLRYLGAGQKEEDEAPMCPAFEEIAIRLGPPHLSFIPISVGASLHYIRSFSPLSFPLAINPALTSSHHATPYDAVLIHRLTGSRVSMGVHWGTWVGGEEDVVYTVRELRRACRTLGVRFGRWTGRVADVDTDVNDVKTGGAEARAKEEEPNKFVVVNHGATISVGF